MIQRSKLPTHIRFSFSTGRSVNETTLTELDLAKHKLATELDELIQLRPLSSTALQIMRACQDQDLDVQDLIQMVECDAAISARVLSMVNSSMYGYSREIASIDQAVVVLGFKSLSQLAVSIASEKVFSEGELAVDARTRLYDHSIGCAAVARILANRCGLQSESGTAFLAGMLHDVGKLVFFDIAPINYAEVYHQPDSCLVEQEQNMFGIDHTSVGERFGEHWGLPTQINQAIAQHHTPIDETTDPILRITALANELAKTWGIGQEACPTECEMTLHWIDQQSPEALEEYRGEASRSFSELKSLLSS
jgi:putative nucleotidyltransferase with HDIG domain